MSRDMLQRRRVLERRIQQQVRRLHRGGLDSRQESLLREHISTMEREVEDDMRLVGLSAWRDPNSWVVSV